MRTRSMAPHSHTRHALTHGQWLSHTSCSSVLFISIHRDATSLRLSASSDRKWEVGHITHAPMLLAVDRSVGRGVTYLLAILGTCRVVRARPSDCRLSSLSPHAGHHICSPPKYPSVPLPHVLVGPDHRARLSSHATCTSLPPPQPSGRRLHAAACSPPARRLHAACAAFGRAPLTRA